MQTDPHADTPHMNIEFHQQQCITQTGEKQQIFVNYPRTLPCWDDGQLYPEASSGGSTGATEVSKSVNNSLWLLVLVFKKTLESWE